MSEPGKEAGRAHVLVVEDSSVFREMQDLLLRQAGYHVSSHENPHDALAAAAKQTFELVVIDYELPDMNGEQFMHAVRKLQPDIEVVFVSGALTQELVVRLGTQRVSGIFHKPTNPKTLLEKVDETLARHAARDTEARVGSRSPHRNGGAHAPVGASAVEPTADRLAYSPRFLLGKSDTFRELTHRLWKVRDFRAVLLLQGEPGTPFELVARELAEISLFRDGPVMVCEGARFEPLRLIEVLAPSLLSHDAGTLLVTGIESFTTEQQKTLENLMTGRDVFLPFARRFRLVLAATGELSERVDAGTFGETLYYKASALTLTVPPLREMRGDIATNAERILAAQREAGHPETPATIANDAAEWLETQDWPGNYAELARTVLHAARFANGGVLTTAAITASWPTLDQAGDGMLHVAAASATAVDPHAASAGGRPPFPMASSIATDDPHHAAAATATSIRQTPAGQLFARAAQPARTPATHSLFRPASSQYSFAGRLAVSLDLARATAH